MTQEGAGQYCHLVKLPAGTTGLTRHFLAKENHRMGEEKKGGKGQHWLGFIASGILMLDGYTSIAVPSCTPWRKHDDSLSMSWGT